MGEPPACSVTNLSLTTSPPGMKKLVPACRSSNKRMPPAKSTGNESSARIAVVNQDQHVSGIRIKDMPRVRMFKSVVMKFKAPSNEAMQKMAIEVIHNVTPAPCPGPALLPSALKVG